MGEVSAKSVGIIGGADGPTSIYIATSVNWTLLIGVAIGVVLIAGFIVWKKKHR